MKRPDDRSSELQHLNWTLDRKENFFELLAAYLSAGSPLGLNMAAFRFWIAFGTKTTAN